MDGRMENQRIRRYAEMDRVLEIPVPLDRQEERLL